MVSNVFSAAWNTLATSARARRLLLSNDREFLCVRECVGDFFGPLVTATAAWHVLDRWPTAMAFSCSSIAIFKARTCLSIYKLRLIEHFSVGDGWRLLTAANAALDRFTFS